jgi:hypothetical protein
MIDELPIGLTEDDTKYDGPFSHYGEWHAASIGLGIGVSIILATRIGPAAVSIVSAVGLRLVVYAITGKRAMVGERVIDLPDRVCAQIRDEPHYLTGGIVVGVIVMTVVSAGINIIP